MFSDQVFARAQLHAALGEPHRLVIAEALAIGDLSPVSIADQLGIQSNLMAHHVSVLESAGVLTRTRSEADRRRVYLSLTATGRAAVEPPSLLAPEVLFVCTHNSARSQFAQSLWERRSSLPGRSAGTEPSTRINPLARRVARRHGIDFGRRTPSLLDTHALADALVVTVCDRADEELADVDHLHWSVPDPAASAATAEFERAYESIADRVEILADAMAGQA